MNKRIVCIALCLLMAGGLFGCAAPQEKHTADYWELFDTASSITVYGRTDAQFAAEEKELHRFLTEYHQLCDIYHDYDGLVNLKAVNDAAGQPVTVDARLIDLLTYGLDAYRQTDGRVNIMLGSVLVLWHECREAATENPDAATLPDDAALHAAAAHTAIDSLIIDRAAGTVQITDPLARLDVGAIAKGYVTERAAEYARDTLGWTSALLNIGGNIRAIGKKPGDKPFTVGIQNPDTSSAKTYVDTVSLCDAAAVTSGDYQRFFTVDGVRYGHIIDKDTLYPARYMRSVSIVCADSALADVLSTALFSMPVEEGLSLLAHFDGAAVYVTTDGTVRYSPGFDGKGTGL